MAGANFVVVRRTISQTIVPYKDVEERLLLKRSKSNSNSLGFCSSNNVARFGVTTPDSRKKEKVLALERSRSEVCLRRKSCNVREISLDVLEEGRKEGLVKPGARRGELREVNRPRSDFFPEFSIKNMKPARSSSKLKEEKSSDADKRLGRCIATLRREMMSLRKQDLELLKQLTSLNEHIQDMKEIAEIHGGLFGSNYEEYEDQQLMTQITSNSLSDSSIDVKNSSRKGQHKNDEDAKRKISASIGKRVKSSIQGLQETSFEYTEIPGDTSAIISVRPKVMARRPQSTIADVSRKKTASHRLERKSLSCQFLDSTRRERKQRIFAKSQETLVEAREKKRSVESEEILSSTKAEKMRPLSQNFEVVSKDQNTRKKSVSLSQLRSLKKPSTEGSTSDSECSTSGCYGGSSTGSEAEFERTRVEESSERLDKVFEFDLMPLGKRYNAMNLQQQFCKKIVSV